MKSIDFKIAELRKIKGITQLQLAEELGVTYQAVSKWETKSTMPDISLLPQIADYFDVSIDQLLGVKPIEKTKYITRDTGKSSFWDDKSKYLKNTREHIWNMDYLKFLVEDVWRFREPIDIIDFGCGIGYMGLTLLDVLPKGSTYTGVDLSEKLLLDAKENLKSFSGSTEFIVSDIFDYETDKTYDLAICQAFLRHIDSPKKALEIMSKSVKSGGSVICVEVNRPFENAGLYIEGARYAPSKKGSLLQKIWDSEQEHGERDHAIGFKAPMYMDQIGLVDIDVRLSDRINLMLPSDSDYEKKRNILISSQGWDSRDESSYNSVSMLLKNRGLDEFEAKSYMDIDKEMIELFQSNKQSRMIHTYGLVISRGVKK